MVTCTTTNGDVPLGSAGTRSQPLRTGDRDSVTYAILVPFAFTFCAGEDVLDMLTRAQTAAEALAAAERVVANGRVLVEMLTAIECDDDEVLSKPSGDGLYEAVGLRIGTPVVVPLP